MGWACRAAGDLGNKRVGLAANRHAGDDHSVDVAVRREGDRVARAGVGSHGHDGPHGIGEFRERGPLVVDDDHAIRVRGEPRAKAPIGGGGLAATGEHEQRAARLDPLRFVPAGGGHDSTPSRSSSSAKAVGESLDLVRRRDRSGGRGDAKRAGQRLV